MSICITYELEELLNLELKPDRTGYYDKKTGMDIDIDRLKHDTLYAIDTIKKKVEYMHIEFGRSLYRVVIKYKGRLSSSSAEILDNAITYAIINLTTAELD